jgi:hypothetical protein
MKIYIYIKMKSKMPSSLKTMFQGREPKLRDTTPNSPTPHGADLICCGQEMTCREHSALTGAPVAALGKHIYA